jgi:hypothetical protein
MSTRVGISAAAHSGRMTWVGELQLGRLRQSQRGAPELDTYKQSAQPSIHAGFRAIEGSEMNTFVRWVRNALYGSASMCLHIPAGPLFHLAIVRGVVLVDGPLRAYLLGGAYAKSTG